MIFIIVKFYYVQIYIIIITVFKKKNKKKQKKKKQTTKIFDWIVFKKKNDYLHLQIDTYTNRTIINSNFTFKSVSIVHIVSKTRGEIDHSPNYTYTYRDSRYM